MALHRNIAGTWKSGRGWRNVAGTWKECAVWRNVGGVWKQITALVSLPATIFVNDRRITASSTAFFSLLNTGAYSSTGNLAAPSGTWLGAGAASDYDCRLTITSGTLSSGTAATWLNLGTSRTWSKNDPAAGTLALTGIGTLEIRRASDLVVVATSTLTLRAFNDSNL
jgi:hypothetical protein